MADAAPKSTLLELATNQFGEDIWPAEAKLFEAAEKGTEADCEKAPGAKGIIRSDRLSWLCTDSNAALRVTYRGVTVCEAEIQAKVDLDWAKISFPVRARRCVFKEPLIVRNSHLVSLDLANTSIQGLYAYGDKIEHDVFLGQGFKAEGVVDLRSATIGGQLNCTGGQFISKGETPALSANGAKIEGTVNLGQGFKAEGVVDLGGATIGGQLNCTGGQFISKAETPALSASGAQIASTVFLGQGFKAEGGVDLRAATIGGNLDCGGGRFVNQGKIFALDADYAKIEGVVSFQRMLAEGEVRFAGAHAGAFHWWNIKSPEKSTLDLRFTKVGTLYNDQDSRPNEGNLRVGGFVYDQIDDRASPNADAQLGWLRLQPKGAEFLSQPYEQLAAVFRERGLEEDVRQVMIEKNKEHGRHLQVPIWDWRPWMWFDWISWLFKWSWYRIFGNALVGYGYRPGRAFGWSLLVIAIGWLLFHLGYDWNLVTPTGDKAYVVEKDGTRRLKNGRPQVLEEYPKFNAFVYSVETFVPLLKLGMSQYWIPNETRHHESLSGRFLRYYLWCHIIAGWVLTTLWIGGLTGLGKT